MKLVSVGTMAPKVVIIVLNWNGRDDTVECLESLGALEYPNFEVIVVDNGSSDDSVAVIRARFPSIVLLETCANLGYAGGNNVGVRHAISSEADYLLILNNDTLVDKGLLTELVRAAKAYPEAGIYGPKIYYQSTPDLIWFSGARWNSDNLDFEHIGLREKDTGHAQDICESDYITGCALFASAKVFRDIGYLDERFFLTFEETDWCYRARSKGYRCLLIPRAVLWHKVSSAFGGEASPLIEYFMYRNRLLWGSRHLDAQGRAALRRKTRQYLMDTFVATFVVNADAPLLRKYLWAVSSWLRTIKRRLSDPMTRARLSGIRDYYFRRFGDCPPSIREMQRRGSKQ